LLDSERSSDSSDSLREREHQLTDKPAAFSTWGYAASIANIEITEGAVIAERYRLERLIGQGGMGAVWSATHLITHARVALKFLAVPAHQHEQNWRRFLSEARAATAVRHPHVLQVFDAFALDDRTPVLVLDLLEGETLGAHLKRRGSLSVQETAFILTPVVSAVMAAHAQGIAHRDIKPDNVFLARQDGDPDSSRQDDAQHGTVKPMVLDFGIAKLLDQAASDPDRPATATGTTVGTPRYMAPEQGFAEEEIDHRVDTWALGVVLYQCLSGTVPIVADSLGQFLKRLMSEAITPLRIVEPDLPEPLTELVDRMLSRDRDDRPELTEVHALLEGHVPEDPVSLPLAEPAPQPQLATTVRAGAPGLAPQSASGHDTASAGGATLARAPAQPKRGPSMTLIAALMLLGCVALLSLLMSNKDDLATTFGPFGSATSAATTSSTMATDSSTTSALSSGTEISSGSVVAAATAATSSLSSQASTSTAKPVAPRRPAAASAAPRASATSAGTKTAVPTTRQLPPGMAGDPPF